MPSQHRQATFAQWRSPNTVPRSAAQRSDNGRSVDSPLVQPRYRAVWENYRLNTREGELPAMVSEDDLSGVQASMAWRTVLLGCASSVLQRVVAHHHQDVPTRAQLWLRRVLMPVSEEAERCTPLLTPSEHESLQPALYAHSPLSADAHTDRPF